MVDRIRPYGVSLRSPEWRDRAARRDCLTLDRRWSDRQVVPNDNVAIGLPRGGVFRAEKCPP